MYCEKCGAELEDGSKFCTNCGASVEDYEEKKEEPTEQLLWDDDLPKVPDNRRKKKNEDKESAGRSMWIVSIGITILILLVTAVALWMILKSEKSISDDSDITVQVSKAPKKEEAEELDRDDDTATADIREEEDATEDDELERKFEEVEAEYFRGSAKAKAEAEAKAETEAKAVPTQAPIQEPTTVSLAAAPDLSGLREITVIAANASSTISQTKNSNDPMLLFDHRDDTSWQEGVDGYGVNEAVNFSFDGMHKVKYIAFKLGNWKNDKYYYGNAKPKL